MTRATNGESADMNRRELILTGGACLIVAPAIVRYSSLMPVKAMNYLPPDIHPDFIEAVQKVNFSDIYAQVRPVHWWGSKPPTAPNIKVGDLWDRINQDATITTFRIKGIEKDCVIWGTFHGGGIKRNG